MDFRKKSYVKVTAGHQELGEHTFFFNDFDQTDGYFISQFCKFFDGRFDEWKIIKKIKTKNPER